LGVLLVVSSGSAIGHCCRKGPLIIIKFSNCWSRASPAGPACVTVMVRRRTRTVPGHWPTVTPATGSRVRPGMAWPRRAGGPEARPGGQGQGPGQALPEPSWHSGPEPGVWFARAGARQADAQCLSPDWPRTDHLLVVLPHCRDLDSLGVTP
jgi:hypothetical protein